MVVKGSPSKANGPCAFRVRLLCYDCGANVLLIFVLISESLFYEHLNDMIFLQQCHFRLRQHRP